MTDELDKKSFNPVNLLQSKINLLFLLNSRLGDAIHSFSTTCKYEKKSGLLGSLLI